ncbi:bis(5'-nucleosyl)-tetraphosphatase PrpE [asymmetrical]-like [Glandiceps talaboti]
MAALVTTLVSLFVKQSEFKLTPRSNIPTPKRPHVTFDEETLEGKRIIMIGDVHGCYDELMEILEQTQAHEEDAIVIFVGDLINKGPKNKTVLDFVKKMRNAYAVRGNHDEAVLREMKAQKNEGYELSKKYKWTAELNQSDWDYLSELPYTITIHSKKMIIVHAGLVPGKPLSRQQAPDMITMRNIVFSDYFGGKGWQTTTSGNEGHPWGSLWPGPFHVYYGHDAKRKLQLHEHATGLDTGCVYGGCLTALMIDLDNSKKFFTVKAHSVYREPDQR